MTEQAPDQSPLDVEGLRDGVQAALEKFLGTAADELAAISTQLDPVTAAVRDFLLVGGKRLRPAFAYWGWRGAAKAGAGAHTSTEHMVQAAAALELLHACALIHDDVMDDSDTRRGAPAVHRRFAEAHRLAGWEGDPDTFGRSAAILVGDMCLVWADRMFATCGLPAAALQRAQPGWDGMRQDLMAGQFLDVLGQADGTHSVDRSLLVTRYKTAKYTVEGPLRIGAALAGAQPGLVEAYSAYGMPLGEAFQLRDDVLGIFGDPAETGKPAGDDLREGKRTVLVATAVERATPPQAAKVARLLGDPELNDDGVDQLREVMIATGALDQVEQLIADRTQVALAALASGPVSEPARTVLSDLAVAATSRNG